MGLFKREEKKVRETVELYVSGMIEKDIEMIMSLVALDEDLLVIDQDPYEKTIGAKKFYKSVGSFLKIVQDLNIEIKWMFLSVADNMSWVNSEMTYTFIKHNKEIVEDRSVTFVLEKRRGDWYIVHIINSLDPVSHESEDANEEFSDETEVYKFQSDDLNLEIGEGDLPEKVEEVKIDQEIE